jgi:hypothetical protein
VLFWLLAGRTSARNPKRQSPAWRAQRPPERNRLHVPWAIHSKCHTSEQLKIGGYYPRTQKPRPNAFANVVNSGNSIVHCLQFHPGCHEQAQPAAGARAERSRQRLLNPCPPHHPVATRRSGTPSGSERVEPPGRRPVLEAVARNSEQARAGGCRCAPAVMATLRVTLNSALAAGLPLPRVAP